MIHNYGECNHFFCLWITLVTEWLEIQFNPSSRGEEEGPEIDKRIMPGQANYLLDREEIKERISGQESIFPVRQTCEPKPTQSNSLFSYFVFVLP